MDRSAVQRLTLRIIGCTGLAPFAFFFFLTYHTPQWVEDFAADYIENQVADHVDATIDGLGAPQGENALSRYAAQLYEENEARIAGMKQYLKKEARVRLIDCIDKARSLTPEQRAKFDGWIEMGAQVTIGSLTVDNSKLADLIQSGYLKVVAELKREIRGFTAINAIAFLLLLLASFLRPEAVRSLFVPGALLFASTLLCAWLYVFEQNWLLTMVQGSYVGKAYAVYLGLVFLFLCDIALNRARITTRLLGGIPGF
jgi:hypothetical protein